MYNVPSTVCRSAELIIVGLFANSTRMMSDKMRRDRNAASVQFYILRQCSVILLLCAQIGQQLLQSVVSQCAQLTLQSRGTKGTSSSGKGGIAVCKLLQH